jgi:hypothetical protein
MAALKYLQFINADSKAQVPKSMAQLLKLNSAVNRALIAQLQKLNNSFTKIPHSKVTNSQMWLT